MHLATRNTPRRVAVLGAVLLALVLAGCDGLSLAPPTETLAPLPTPEPFRVPTLDASEPTRLPGARIEEMISTAVAQFTPAAPPVVGELRLTVTPTPVPTLAALPMRFIMQDGLRVEGIFYGAPVRPAPTVLLLHMEGGSKTDWADLAAQLQQAGMNALTIDVRGFGLSEGAVNWPVAVEDVKFILARLAALPGVDARRLTLAGAGLGANVAFTACADTPDCRAAALLSPLMNAPELPLAGVPARYAGRPVFIAAGRLDAPSGQDAVALRGMVQGVASVFLYDSAAHGTLLLVDQPALVGILVRWIGEH
ncbi:MAG: alpha/beta hydrolase [Anaerolineae bacterium]|nr:alpha/beta hydrolase [Anaerolineae bacterium]